MRREAESFSSLNTGQGDIDTASEPGSPGRTDTEGESSRQRSKPLLKRQNSRKKLRSFRIRAVSTFVLIGSFILIIYLGHVPLMMMIFGIQLLMGCNDSSTGSSRQNSRPMPSLRMCLVSCFSIIPSCHIPCTLLVL
ncbi:hypothetical protein WJX74_001084 [Apatococcus lobatus]|uniref:Phosphatidate cytidylyltransferase n=1 Tax=Apatococcus lobatus TaxID=904363 RepID=A0AAW1QJL2_9CHLO